jgi:O-antigen ligase
LGLVAYLLAVFPAVWLAAHFFPVNFARRIPCLWGLGAIVAAFLVLRESSYCLECVRAKANLGIIELGAILGQIPPLLLGALAIGLKEKKKLRSALLIVSLVASYVALRINCSRIALIVAPLGCFIMLAVFRDYFGKIVLGVLLILFSVGGALVITDSRVQGRLRDMLNFSGSVASNQVRIVHWRQGWDVFKENPALGVGPNAVPNARYEDLPVNERHTPHPEFYHAHQTFLTVLAESGLIGLVGFLALHLCPLAAAWPARRSQDPQIRFWVWAQAVVFLQLFLNGMIDHVFTLKPLMYIYWSVTAISLWKARKEASFL